MPRLAIPLLSALVLTVLIATPAAAQSVWLDRDHRTSVLVEALFPDYAGVSTGFPTWTWFVSGRVPVGRTLWIEAELPYSRAEFESPFLEDGASKIGNPYLGVELVPNPDRGVRFEFGLRAPLIELEVSEANQAIFNGILADVERREAFYADYLPIHTAIRYHQSTLTSTGGVGYDIRLTPEVLIPVGDEDDVFVNPEPLDDGDTEVVLGYLGTVQYAVPSMRVGAGLTGAWVTTGDGDFDENSNHQLEFMADFLDGPVRPGVQLKIPLDSDPFAFESFVWGFSLNILPGHSGQ